MNKRHIRSTLSKITRFYPFAVGRGRIANSKLFRKLDPSDVNAVTLARLSNGQNLWVASRDFVGRAVTYFGDLDETITTVLKRLLRPGDTFVDIGAQFGLYTVKAAELVGAGGSVHSFEPQQRSADLLASSLRLNGLENVTIHRFGLGSDESVLSMVIPDGNVGGGSLVHQFERGETVDVSIRHASTALFEAEVSEARLIKIDVEGYESEVIAGAIDWIQEVQPDALVIETAARNPLSSYPFYSQLTEAGYSFVQIGRSLFGLSLLDVDPDSRLTGFDVVAFRNQETLDQLRGQS